jgi:hypothetical protein
VLAQKSNSRSFSITVEALARCYDHLVINGGVLGDLPPELLAPLASRAVLIAGDAGDAMTVSAQERLNAVGFAHVVVLAKVPARAEAGVRAGRAA